MQERPHKQEVALSEEQRYALHQLISKGKAPGYCQLSSMMSLFSSQSGEEILIFGQFYSNV